MNFAEDFVKKIVNEQINEKATLDYKVEDYNLKENKYEFLKDIIAMLNSDEALGKDKFIILGIVDGTHYIKGLNTEVRDDNEYQNVFSLINPRPSIDTGKVEIGNKVIGYLHIKKENKNRPYEIQDPKDTRFNGKAYTRRGSTNVPLTQQERDEMLIDKFRTTNEYAPLYNGILQKNLLTDESVYKAKNYQGKISIDPSNNNGKFTIGKGKKEFILKLDTASNDVGRIYNDNGIQVARIQRGKEIFDSPSEISIDTLDFTSRVRRYTKDDLAIIVNKFGSIAVLVFCEIFSESHGAPEDKMVIKWKIIF